MEVLKFPLTLAQACGVGLHPLQEFPKRTRCTGRTLILGVLQHKPPSALCTEQLGVFAALGPHPRLLGVWLVHRVAGLPVPLRVGVMAGTMCQRRAGEFPFWQRGQRLRALTRCVGKDGRRSLPSGPPYFLAVAMALQRCCQLGGGGLCLSPLGFLEKSPV